MNDSVTGYSDGDVDTNRTDNPTIHSIIEARYSRRSTLFGGAQATIAAVFGSSLLAACGDDTPTNTLPVVTAGANASTTSGRVVTLTGTATDMQGAVTALWRQTSGPTVTLNNANTLTATFLAPSVSVATPLAFELVGTDIAGATATGATIITVSPATIGFTSIPKSLADVVAVPAGYSVSVLYSLGDPIAAGVPAFANDGTDTNFAQRAGDHGDALYYFGLNATTAAPDPNNSLRGLLVMNHENITQVFLHPNGPTTVGGARPEAEALKEMEAHGTSTIEVVRANANGAWSYVQSSGLNRRITPLTLVAFNGPVRGSIYLQTVFSPTGVAGRGTVNNCANGFTAWSTSLTCEENWAGYFRRRTATDNPLRTAKEVTALTRYGVTSSTGNYGWATVTPAVASTIYQRWTSEVTGASATADFRNEANQFGWVVESDPYSPTSTPRKRTALGRFNHEGAWPSNFVVGVRPAIYMGDDSRGEYIYKFVSATPWVAADATATDRLAIGDKYLDAGTLYVARFNADGTGNWLPLVFGTAPLTAANAAYPFADQADVLTHARLAADALGATRMDRPEWTATNNVTGEIYVTLTNNTTAVRPITATDAANPRHYQDPRPSAQTPFGNPNGHILRFRETGNTTEATTFAWDIYLFGAGADLNATNINISGLDATNDFSSPDGLWFGRPQNASGLVNPIVWIETDDNAYTDVTNCMLLVGQPGNVGDGGARTITNIDAGGATRTQATIVGKAPGTTLRRFLVGPKECEITGIDSTPDGRTIFVNIQHPGELATTATAPFNSNWPASQTNPAAVSRPRSSTIVITKDDGGIVGL